MFSQTQHAYEFFKLDESLETYFDYEKQVVVNFLTDDGGITKSGHLQTHWNSKHPDSPCTIFVVRPNDLVKPILPVLDLLFKDHQPVIKLYVLIHGSIPGENLFKGDCLGTDGVQYTFNIGIEQLAVFLAKIIGQQQKVVVNLLACAAGRGSKDSVTADPEKSIAAQLSRFLEHETKRNIPIVARTHFVWMPNYHMFTPAEDVIKYTSNLNDNLIDGREPSSKVYKQAGSKIFFTRDKTGSGLAPLQ